MENKMRGRKNKKILLISDRKDVIESTAKACSAYGQDIEVNVAGSVESAMEEILKNGFDLTVLDCSTRESRSISIKYLVELNHTVNKNLIMICRHRDQERFLKQFKDSDVMDSVRILKDKHSAQEFLTTLATTLKIPRRDSCESLRLTLAQMQEEKESVFQKYSFLSFV
jgi:DNA-binding NtrC family response regulator